MANKCRRLTPEERTEWNKIQQLPEVERATASETFVKRIMESGEKFFPRSDVNLTDVTGALAREGIDATKPVASRKELTPAEARENELVPGKPEMTEAQADALIAPLSEYIMNPNTKTAWEVTKALRTDDRAGRKQKLEDRVQQLIIEEGIEAEQAMNLAKKEALSGKYPTLTTNYFSELTDTARKAYFSKVSHVLKNEGFEMISTKTALANALAGRPIPSDPGTTGRSAYTRLQRVFGEEFKAIEKIADKKKSLRDTIEGIYYEVGHPPIPIDEEMANYLRGLSDTPVRVLPLFKRVPVSMSAKIVESTFAKVLPNLTVGEKQTISRVFSELGWLPFDIGNTIRAHVATLDLSFWRQVKTLALGHLPHFYRGNVEAWKAMPSEKAAEANWEWIRVQPAYAYYEQAKVAGWDYLRVLVAPKGTAQHEAAEEFGYLNRERWLPRMVSDLPWISIPGRHFTTGINTTTILIANDFLKATMRRAEKIASGEIKLKEGESFSIEKEMVDIAKYLSNLSQRGSLGPARAMAPAINAMFFSLRSKLGRLFTPRHLWDSNPRVRRMAWKDLSLFVGITASIVMLGKYMEWWDVELDPKNAEFMSIRIGNMRIDPWAGNRQHLVLFTRIITGTGVSSVTGAEYEANPLDVFQSYLRNSGSPLAGIAWDYITGKDFKGEPFDPSDARGWLERVTPFAVQDIWEAMEDGWEQGVVAVVPAILGEGVTTYTGDWQENFDKLGTPKYPENTAYGMTEPVYDVNDLWADTVGRFKGVAAEELTESKDFPEFLRSMVETKNELLPIINDLPNTPLYEMNGDPSKGKTFIDYRDMWRDREKIVESGDEEALKAFDAHENTNDAYKGNITANQYSLLVLYNLQSDEDKVKFLEDNPELREKPREEWLKANPLENAQLAVWGVTSRNNRVDLETSAAYNHARKLIDELGIPDSALLGIPPARLGTDFKGYLDLLNSGVTSGSDEAQFYRLIHPEYEEWHTGNWHGDGASPADFTVTERYGTSKVRDLVEDYYDIVNEDSRVQGKDRLLFRQGNKLLDAYFVYAKGYVPVINSGWDSVDTSQILEWYKLRKARSKKVTSTKKPQDPRTIYIGIIPKSGGGGTTSSSGTLEDYLGR